ncbi:histone deacetylase family protein [Tundrisphaera sp. TA3]|uniref:histone deacetylase family protein n=1 Tax=Tundrisphaera sp. TA3 TaxID=3435775 RepID=UPI003EBDCFD7
MKVYSSDRFPIPLPDWHRFPMAKYARLRDRVVGEGIVAADDILIPRVASLDELARAHDPAYLRRVMDGTLSAAEVREIGFPWSPELVERSRRSSGATVEACLRALDEGISVNLAGGTHHAYRDHGAGYCVFNDAATAARALQDEGLALRVLIVDCDVHQGDGTASIFADDPTVFTFSIHGARNYPMRKQSSDLDVELPDAADDDAYLNALAPGLELALDRAGADLAIYLAGADPFVGDRLGRLAVTKAGLAERDRLVLSRLRGAGLPVAIAMAGGYGTDVDDTVDIHVQTVRIAAEFAP